MKKLLIKYEYNTIKTLPTLTYFKEMCTICTSIILSNSFPQETEKPTAFYITVPLSSISTLL